MKLLFVCLGNICRSPSAEAIARKFIAEQGLSWEVDSAGTSGYHQGEMADSRAIAHAQKRGYEIASLARAIQTEDFKNFDWILAMDESNLKNLKKLCPAPQYQTKICLITDFSQTHRCQGVPDPYWGEGDGFERVLDILEDAIASLLAKLKA